MAVDKKFFVDINLQGNALNNATIGSNSDMTKGGSFRFDGERLEYYNGSSVQSVANLSDIASVTGGLILQGGYDAATNTPDIADGTAKKGYFWVVTEAGSFLGESVQVGDSIIAKIDNAGPSIGDWLILQGNVVIATDTVDGIVRLATQAEVDAGTEGGAVVVTPATLQSKIDSQITPNIDDKLSKTGGTMSGGIDMSGNTIANASLIDSSLLSELNANDNAITNLPTPINGGDAANKTYVDTAAATAQSNAEATASADATTKANAAQSAAESYADGLAVNYDPAGAAATAQANAESFATTAANTAQSNAEAYADSLAPNYDPAGSAATAQSNAETFATSAANQALSDANTYTDNQIAAQTFSSTYASTAWVYNPNTGTYQLSIEHGLNTICPFVVCYLSDQIAEFNVLSDVTNFVTLNSNVAVTASVTVRISK